MEKNALDILCQQVFQQYPLFKGQKPIVSKQGSDRYLLVFITTGETPDGKSIQQKLRVVSSASGQVLKTTMSR